MKWKIQEKENIWDLIDLDKMNNYPTQDEILSKKPKFKKETIHTIKTWKKDHIKDWKYKNPKEKIKLLKTLIKSLEDIYEKPIKDIINSDTDMYDQKNKTIYLNLNKPSIISTLHEFAHHILGTNELKACQWSYWIFAECFPGLLKKLIWEKHLLVKK